MNILFLAHRIPYPPNKGDKIRSFNEIRYLSKEHNLYLAFLVDDKNDIPYLNELKKYCKGLDYDVINPRWQKIKSLPYLLTNRPLSVPCFYSKKLQDAIDKKLAEIEFDVIFIFSSPMAEYIFRSKFLQFKPLSLSSRFNRQNGHDMNNGINRLNRIKLIMDFVDVDSDKWRVYTRFSPLPFSLIYKREWKRLKSYERKIGRIFDWNIFVSEKEVELFKSFCPEASSIFFSNGVDFDFYKNEFSQSSPLNGPNRHNGPNLLFIGAMDYFPNEDAVLFFSTKIWPYVKKELPNTKFYIVGGKPSKRVKVLSQKDPNIIVTGYVQDIRPYLGLADVFVAPLRIARGIQNKILEAMAAGVPVVARPEAVQGLNGYDGCIRVEENNKRFALSILELVKIPHKRHKMVHDAKRFVLENHNWEENLKKLERVIQS
jgi:polysaccharide biosynthesis protein PslH